MSRATFADAIDEMYGLLSANPPAPVQSLADAGVVRALDYEPGANGWLKPCTVTLWPSRITPEFWMVGVRVYVAPELSPRAARDLLLSATVAVDAALKAGEGYGPSDWTLGWQDTLDCYLASSEVMVGREDGF